MALYRAFWISCRCFAFLLGPKDSNVGYFAVTNHDVPTATLLIAKGREAWRLADAAVSYFPVGPGTCGREG